MQQSFNSYSKGPGAVNGHGRDTVFTNVQNRLKNRGLGAVGGQVSDHFLQYPIAVNPESAVKHIDAEDTRNTVNHDFAMLTNARKVVKKESNRHSIDHISLRAGFGSDNFTRVSQLGKSHSDSALSGIGQIDNDIRGHRVNEAHQGHDSCMGEKPGVYVPKQAAHWHDVNNL